ncbi:MAG: polysaccharide biosynthesis tyrosine autokinase, partial [Calditrichaeota bacterium]
MSQSLNNHSNNNGFQLKGGGAKEHTVHDYLAVLYRSRWLILSIFAATMAGVSYYTFFTPPTYQASATMMIDDKQGFSESLFDVTGLNQQRTMINNQVEILKSRHLAQAVITRLLKSPKKDSLALFEQLGKEMTLVDVIDFLRESITAAPVRETDLISLKVTARTPWEAAFLANTIADVYRDFDRDFTRGEIKQVVKFLDEQLKRKEKDLKESEDSLKEFLKNEQIASLSDEVTQVVEQSANFESLYKEAEIDKEVNKKRLEYLKDLLRKSTSSLETEVVQVSSPLILQLREEMAEIERTIAVYLSQGVNETDPEVMREKDKLEAIKRRLTEETRKLILQGLPADDPLTQAQDLVLKIIEVETEMTASAARAKALQRVVASYNAKMEALPDQNVKLAQLERNRKVDENLYMMMREKYEESRITQAGQIGKVRILDRALPPATPISPRVKLNLILGLIMGLGLGVGTAFARDFLDVSIRRVEEIEEMGLTVLGAIPKIDPYLLNGSRSSEREFRGKNGKDEAGQIRLVTHFKPKSPVSEAYRTLRTNLQFSESEHNLHSFLVTSTGPGEGKSTTITNLAITVGMQGKRTILVDADLRRPVLHKVFGLERNLGLSNILVQKASLDSVIQATGVRNLEVITSGVLPPNPAEMLGSNRMQELIDALRQRYDLCLFDTPPLIAVTDAAVLGKMLDGVLLVVKAGQTRRDAVRRGME